ncbi:MAG: hypothetical protein EOP88_09335 [Verrucomicrobiaceae bacterium]|nr:MAG: hypothetical protein EOP88_09335 [Verrucomicrobiaceae bacterium]
MKNLSLLRKLRALLAGALSFAFAASASADILVSSTTSGNIARYRNDGSLVNANFAKGMSGPSGIHVTKTHIYVACIGSGTVRKLNLDGTIASMNFITNVSSVIGLTSDETHLYITRNAGAVGKYNLNTGGLVAPLFITGIGTVEGITHSSGILTVVRKGNGTVNRYNTFDGSATGAVASGFVSPSAIVQDNLMNTYVADKVNGKIAKYDVLLSPINTSFISGPPGTTGLAFVNNNLAAVNNASGNVALYNSSGTLLNGSFITGLKGAFGIAYLNKNTPPAKPTLTVKGDTSVTTTKSSITLKGTSKNATSVQVKVGDAKAVKTAEVSPWSYKANLKKGKNTIVITAKGPGGKSKSVTVVVTRKVKKSAPQFPGTDR